MTRDEIWEKVKAIAADHFVYDKEKITRETNVKDISADSLYTVEFAMSLENGFDIPIPDDLVDRCRTIGDYADLVENIMKK